MNTHRVLPVVALALFGGTACLAAGESKHPDDSILRQTFDLAGPRSAQVQVFDMETRVITYAPDGKRVNTDILRLQLKCTPARVAGKEADEYTCLKFTLQFGSSPEVAVPAMVNWTYLFKNAATGLDEK